MDRGKHDGVTLAAHVVEVLQRYSLDDGRLMGITTDNASANYTMCKALEDALGKLRVRHHWEAAKYHVPCMAHVIQLCLGAFMSALEVRSRERHQTAVDEGIELGGEGSEARTRKLREFCDMPPGFAKIIEKVS